MAGSVILEISEFIKLNDAYKKLNEIMKISTANNRFEIYFDEIAFARIAGKNYNSALNKYIDGVE